MLDISLSEILIILVLTLLLVGPDQIPKVARSLGRALGAIRRITEELRFTIDQSIRDEEIDRLKEENRRQAEKYRREREKETPAGADDRDNDDDR